jgi:hypothetical protein
MRIILLVLTLFIAFAQQSQNLKSGGKLKPEQAIMDIRHYTLTLDDEHDYKASRHTYTFLKKRNQNVRFPFSTNGSL